MKLEKKIEVNGINTAVSIREGRRPTIVCIHGNSFSQKLFSPLWNFAGLADYGMITYDLPGHGDSGKALSPGEGYSIPGYALHLKNLLEILNQKSVVLLGFSLGGHIACEAAGNYVGSLLRGFCTIGAPPMDTLEDFGKAFLPMPEGASLFVKDIPEHHCRIIVECMSPGSAFMAEYTADIQRSDSKAREYLMRSLGEGNFHSEHEFLRNTDIPALCMFGGNDIMISSEYIGEDRIKNLLGNRLKISSGGDHLPRWIESEGFMMEFRSFLEDVSA